MTTPGNQASPGPIQQGRVPLRLAALLPALWLAACLAGPAQAQAERLVSRRIALPPSAATEAPDCASDGNWVVRNIVDGRWSAPPFFPNQAWMARHIGEKGFDTWCRLDLGGPHRIHRVRLQDSGLPSFVHLKRVDLEFDDGSRVPITMERNGAIQDFHFAPRVTGSLQLHLVSHYGDGAGIDVNSGGFAEVEPYEIVAEGAVRTNERAFAPGPSGHITTWLALAGPPATWPAGHAPIDGEVVLDGASARSWTINCYPSTAIDLPRGSLLFATLVNRGPGPIRLAVRGGVLPGASRQCRADLPPGRQDLLVEATGGPVVVRCTGAIKDRLTVLLGHGRGVAWEAETLAGLRCARWSAHIVRPGSPIDYRYTAEPVGYPMVGGRPRIHCTVVPGGRPVTLPGPSGVWRAPTREGRYRLRTEWTGLPAGVKAPAVADEPFVVNRRGMPPVGFTDLDGDGRPELLRATWHGKDCLWISDDKSMTRKSTMGKFGGSWCLLVDKDGDGIFDGPDDLVYQAVDVNRDRIPDYEIFAVKLSEADYIEKMAFSLQPRKPYEQDRHYKLSYIDWQTFNYANEQEYTGRSYYRMGVHGNGCFHNGRRNWPDTRLAWENPIAWYDFNNDGWSDMVVRCADFGPPRGKLQEFETAFDVDRDSGPGNECTYNMQLTRTAYRKGALPYLRYRETYPRLAGLGLANYLFVCNPGWRTDPVKTWIPYLDAYRLGTDCTGWEAAWLLFDEDFDDRRWEEMFGVQEPWEGYADHLGDRIETDDDYSGQGQLYVGRFDGKIHLFGAEKGDWTVDPCGLFHGSMDRPLTEEGPLPPAGLRHTHIRYTDTDGNGFFDRIETYESTSPDWRTGDKRPASDRLIRSVSLLDYATPEDPHPDVCELVSTRSKDSITGRKLSDWRGEPVRVRCDAFDRLTALFARITDQAWRDAAALRAAASAAAMGGVGVANATPAGVKVDMPIADRTLLRDVRMGPGYADLLAPRTLRERSANAYWIKENLLAGIVAARPRDAARLKSLYYRGKIAELVAELRRP